MAWPTNAAFDRTFTWLAGGVPVDLTGATFRLQVRAKRDPTSPLVFGCSTVDPSLTVVDAAGGKFRIHVQPYDTSTILPGTYWYDLLVITNATTTRLLEGQLIASPSVTDWQ
jgi:hypothetical protein